MSNHPPTSEEAIQNFPRKVFEESPEDPCVVCQENIAKGETVLILPCGHFFHPECVTPWLRKNNTCPNCRFELPANHITPHDRARNYQHAQNVFRQRLVAALQGDDRWRKRERGSENMSLEEQMAQRRNHHNRVHQVRGMLGINPAGGHQQARPDSMAQRHREPSQCFCFCTVL